MRLLHLSLPGHDLPAQADFYGATLGLPVQLAGGRLTVSIGWSRLSFEPGPAAPAQHLAFSLPWDRFEAAHRWLSGRLPLRRDLNGQDRFFSQNWGSWALYFDDPAGHILELIAYRDWPATQSGDFGPGELLGLAEFGLALNDLPAAAGRLAARLGVAQRSPDDPSFMWLGGPEGRLILARSGRIWFPDTAVPATPGPFRLSLDTPAGERSLNGADLG